jgi:serine/threonine-protein kinase
VLGKAFALKVLRADLSRESELGLRFLREAQAAASVAHPGIIQITDFGSLPTGQSYFVMELLTGVPLSRIIRRGGPLPAARAVRLLRQIVDALAAAHRAGVIHRDLKPDNVFVGTTADGVEVAKVLDFGLARVAGQSRLTKEGLVFGTPHYMSPEQASGGAADHRTDIYALGVVMYEMFTGRVPFEADTFMGVLTKHLYVDPTPPSVVLGGTHELGALEQVTLRCLEKKPERRFPTVDAVAEELERITTWSPDGALRVAPVEPGDRRAQQDGLADELELPGALEVELSRRRSRRALPPLGWTAGVVFFGVVIVAGLTYLATRPARRAAPVTPSAAATSGEPSVGLALAPGAPASAPPLDETPGGGEAVAEPPPAAAGAAGAAPRSPTVKQPRRRAPAGSAGAPAKTSTGKEKMVGSDIVDPWSE